MNEIREKLKSLVEEGAHFDNEGFNAYDYSGGNYDDAYALGLRDGEVSLARELLKLIDKVE